MRGRWTGGWLLAAALAGAAPARAYVRTTTLDAGTPVQWLERCISVQADLRGSQDVPIDEIDAALSRAVSNWSTRTTSCGYLLLTSKPASRVADVATDGQPTVVFRDDVWQRPGDKTKHDPTAIGLTRVFYVDTPGKRGDGTILDADVELNGVNYTFTIDPANATPRPNTQLADLENTLTHELGHVQGLGHSCWNTAEFDDPPLDNTGQPAPDCSDPNLPASIRATTMFPFSSMPGETSKRHLSADDVAGVCEVYPLTTAVLPACFGQMQGACDLEAALGGASGGGTAWPLVLLALARAWRRRGGPRR